MANRWQPAIRALIYCIQFDDDPPRAVDHVLETVVDRSVIGREGYREAVASALASAEAVSSLIPQQHSEETVRHFLALVLARL